MHLIVIYATLVLLNVLLNALPLSLDDCPEHILWAVTLSSFGTDTALREQLGYSVLPQ
jgi:hypothetical protein